MRTVILLGAIMISSAIGSTVPARPPMDSLTARVLAWVLIIAALMDLYDFFFRSKGTK